MTSRFALLFIGFLFTISLAGAQDYVVTLKSDTIRGTAKILSYEKLDKVEIRPDGKGKKLVFTALQARTVFYKGEIYHTVQLESVGLKYMKLIKKGYLSYYGFRLPNQVTYDGLYLRKLDGQGIEVPNLTFKKTLSEYLSDCEALKNKLKAGEYGKRDIEKIIDEYNQCKEQTKPIVAPATVMANDKTQAIDELLRKLDASAAFATKKDAQDILTDIRNKSARNESIPNYMLEGLKSNLNGQTELAEDLKKVLELLQK